MRARHVQEHHQHNWDPTFGRFHLNQREQGLQNLRNIPGNKTWVGKGAAARPASAAGPKKEEICYENSATYDG